MPPRGLNSHFLVWACIEHLFICLLATHISYSTNFFTHFLGVFFCINFRHWKTNFCYLFLADFMCDIYLLAICGCLLIINVVPFGEQRFLILMWLNISIFFIFVVMSLKICFRNYSLLQGHKDSLIFFSKSFKVLLFPFKTKYIFLSVRLWWSFIFFM